MLKMKARGASFFLERVLLYVINNPGIVGADVADHFHVESQTYGRQRATSAAIAALRHRGFLVDVDRCSHCHRALTRGRRNVPLFATKDGKRHAKEFWNSI